jgi:hypothetical protein
LGGLEAGVPYLTFAYLFDNIITRLFPLKEIPQAFFQTQN